MTSIKKIEANRRNARKSTGPRSKLGKVKSSSNAIRHKLTMEMELTEAQENLVINIKDKLLLDVDSCGQLEPYAHVVALALVELSRVREAQAAVWDFASRSYSGKFHGALYKYSGCLASELSEEIEEFYMRFIPEAFEKPIDSADKKNCAIASLAIEKLVKLHRYERKAVNRRNKAIRVFDVEKSRVMACV